MKATGVQSALTVPISYVEKANGDIVITVDAHKQCKRGDVVDFDLANNCDATDFTVTFKNGNSPFGPNGNPHNNKIDKSCPHTGPCTGGDGMYDYTVVLTTKRGTTVTFDPVIIVQGP